MNTHPKKDAGKGIAKTNRRTGRARSTPDASFADGQMRVLEMIATGAPLGETLDSLLRLIESQSPDMLCSILLMDPDGVHLRHGSAPSLPTEYTRAVDGSAIGPSVGSCGTAAFRRERVFVQDIMTDPLWANYRQLVEPHGLRACWSTPILDTQRKLLGTFAIYHRESSLPSGLQLRLIEVATHTAAICINHHRSETSLRESERRFRALIEHSADSIAVIDKNNNILYLSPAVFHVEGYTPEEMVGRNGLENTHPEDLPVIQKAVEQLMANPGKPIPALWRRRHKDGRWLWLEGVAVNLLDDPAVRGIVTNYRDVTDRMQSEETRNKLEGQLRQAQKMEALGTLAGGIAHDFNNILTAIKGNIEMINTDLIPEHPVQAFVKETQQATDRAIDLVRRILTFSRREDVRRKVIRLQPLVEDVLQLLRATLPAMIEIRTIIAADTPDISADRTQIHQVILNLGTNAAHAMGSRGLLEVRVAGMVVSEELAETSADLKAGNYTHLSMSDNGCGMDKATLDRIFEPFFTTKKLGEGTGLGLSVVHGIMKNHGGAVTVYSEPGRGTTFHLYFPASDVSANDTQFLKRESVQGHGERILYVDDERPLVSLISNMLERLGYKMSGFTDAREALTAFRAHPGDFDAIVTDLAMPYLSGPELTRELLKIRPDVPVVMTSGYIRPEDMEVARELGVHDLILKPNTIEDLGQALHQIFVRQRKARKQ